MALPGSPPEDLLLRPDFIEHQMRALGRLATASGRCTTLVGFAEPGPAVAVFDAEPRHLHNSVAVLQGGRVRTIIQKTLLPNYGIFDENRWFGPGIPPEDLIEIRGVRVGIAVCEDIWAPQTAERLRDLGSEVTLVVNASPFHRGKPALREAWVHSLAQVTEAPVVYVNLVGAQDGIVFDGQSVVATPSQGIVWRAHSPCS